LARSGRPLISLGGLGEDEGGFDMDEVDLKTLLRVLKEDPKLAKQVGGKIQEIHEQVSRAEGEKKMQEFVEYVKAGMKERGIQQVQIQPIDASGTSGKKEKTIKIVFMQMENGMQIGAAQTGRVPKSIGGQRKVTKEDIRRADEAARIWIQRRNDGERRISHGKLIEELYTKETGKLLSTGQARGIEGKWKNQTNVSRLDKFKTVQALNRHLQNVRK